jgi:hypothetical protein
MNLNPFRLFRRTRQPAAAAQAAQNALGSERTDGPDHERAYTEAETAATNAAVRRLHHYVAVHGDLQHLLSEEQRAAERADPAALLRSVDPVAAGELERDGTSGADMAAKAHDTLIARYGSADPDAVRLVVLDRYNPDIEFGDHIGEAAADAQLLVSHDYRGDAAMAERDHPDVMLLHTDRDGWEQLQDERTIALITGIREPDGHYANRARGLLVQSDVNALAAGTVDRSAMPLGEYLDWPHREQAIQDYQTLHPDRVQPGRSNTPADLAHLADFVDARVEEANRKSREQAAAEREAHHKERRERWEAYQAEEEAVEAWRERREDPETAWHRDHPEEGFAQGYLSADEAARSQAFSEVFAEGAWNPAATPEPSQEFREQVDQRAQELLETPAYQPRQAEPDELEL